MMFFVVAYRVPATSAEIREWFVVLFEIGLCMMLAAIIYQYDKWIALFLMLVTFSMFWPSYGPMSYLAGRSVFNGCLLYLFIVKFFSVQNLNILYRIMRIFVYFHTVVAAFQWLGVAGQLNVPYPTGLMANPLELAALAVFCLPAFLMLKGWRSGLVAAPVAGVLIAGQSLGMLCLWAGLIFYLAVEYRMYYPLIVSAVLLAGIWIFREHLPFIFDRPGNELSLSITNRLFVWNKAIMAWKQHWIFGSGIGHWKIVFAINPNGTLKPMAVDGKAWLTTHNEFLQMLFELGIGSVIIFVGYIADTIRKATRKAAIPLTALVIIIIYSAASFPMHVAPTAIIAIAWFGILTITLNKEKLKCQMT